MNLRSKSMLPVCIYIYIHIFTNSTLIKHLYLYIYIMYICIFRYAYTHTHIYIYISKKWWQSGSTEKYSVEALCARSSLLRVKSILSYISNYPHIYIYIMSQKVLESGWVERNPLCLVIIIPRIRYMVPTMYTAGFEPARGGGTLSKWKIIPNQGAPKQVRHENHCSCIQSPGNTFLKEIKLQLAS